MNAYIKKIVSVALCLVMLMASVVAIIPESVLPASAATYVSGSNSISSSYANSIYYRNFQRIPLTGDGRRDVVAVALSQLGYKESNSANDFSGLTAGNNNFTEFNYNMGDWGVGYGSTYEWCASFVAWSLLQSGCTDQNSMSDWTRRHTDDPDYIWREVSCVQWAAQLRRYGYWEYSAYFDNEDYIPQSGDLIFFTWAGEMHDEDHIGIVVYSDGNTVYTVEGNTSDAAGLEAAGGGTYFKSYPIDSYNISGYGVLPYKKNNSLPAIDYSGETVSPGIYMASKLKYVYATETGTERLTSMPRFTLFEVSEVSSVNDRVKATFTVDGTTVTGWVMNNEDRIIQLTTPSEKVSMTLKCVDEKGNLIQNVTISGYKDTGDTIAAPSINGYICTTPSVSVVYKSGTTITLTYKSALDDAIEAAGETRYSDYTDSALATLRSVYDEAVALQKNASATLEQKIAMATKLQNAINNTLRETVASKGKKYTTTTPSRGDKWDDDGIRLTDGIKNERGDSTGYAGWNTNSTGGSMQVVVDLGSSVSSNVYRVYSSMNTDWGIHGIAEIKVSVSDDNKTFTQIGSTKSETKTNEDGYWINYIATIKTDSVVKARYVKFEVVAVKGHVWLEEVEVASETLGATGEVYVNGINTKVTSGNTVIFTSDFGKITASSANNANAVNLLAKWDSAQNCYIVKSVAKTGSDVTLAKDEILVCASAWEDDVLDPIAGSKANAAVLSAFKAGDKLALSRIDLENETLGAAATVKEAVDYLVGDVNVDGKVDSLDYLFVKRYCLGTYDLSGDQFDRADINKNENVDSVDYLLVKRMVLGTYGA